MIIRWDAFGDDVTDLPGLWSEEDCEVCETRFAHPTITDGLPTTARVTYWIRSIGGEWVLAQLCRSFSTLRREWRVNQLTRLLPVVEAT